MSKSRKSTASKQKPFKVIFRGDAEKDFAALTQGQQKAIAAKLEELEANPFPPDSIKLDVPTGEPVHRVKARGVRAIYDAPDDQGRIFILAIGPDHEVYQRFGGPPKV